MRTKVRVEIISILILIGCLVYFNSACYEIDQNLKNGVATSAYFSEDPANPTRMSVNNYYKVANEVWPDYPLIYTMVHFQAGEIYLIYYEGYQPYYLYNDAGFSSEIESAESPMICFAPTTTKDYYIKWDYHRTNIEIGVFKADKYTSEQVLEGVSITLVNDDWGRSLFYFEAPDTSGFSRSDFELNRPSGATSWRMITANSGQAYNYNEFSGGAPDDTIFDNPGEGFLIVVSGEGDLKITLPELTPLPIELVVFIAATVVLLPLFLIFSYIIYKRLSSPTFIENRKIKQIEKVHRKKQMVDFKRKLAEIDSKGKLGLIIFISYAFKDSEKFKITEIAEGLTSLPNIEDVVYCEEDALENFIRYMNIYIGKSNALILFCSKNALKSTFVEKEWMAASAMNKPIIPVFSDNTNIPPLLKAEIGYKFDSSDISKNIKELYTLILQKTK